MSSSKPAKRKMLIKPDRDRRFASEKNPFEAMMSRFDIAAAHLNLEPGLYAVLRAPEKQLIVSVPIKRDNGEIEVFTGIRVLHNTSRADRAVDVSTQAPFWGPAQVLVPGGSDFTLDVRFGHVDWGGASVCAEAGSADLV